MRFCPAWAVLNEVGDFWDILGTSRGGGGVEVRNFPQFPTIFLQLLSACPPSVLVSALGLCEQLLQNNMLQCFPAPKKSQLWFNFMVKLRAAFRHNSDTSGRFDLFQHSEAPLQNYCSLRLQEVEFGLVTTPQFSRNFSQLDWTLPDRYCPPPLVPDSTCSASAVFRITSKRGC